MTNKFIVATENVAVSGQYGVTNNTSGYEFWFFDPNGTYSYRRFRNHATSDGFGVGALRANHFRLNAWTNTVNTPHLPNDVLLNVRIRGRVAGVNQPSVLLALQNGCVPGCMPNCEATGQPAGCQLQLWREPLLRWCQLRVTASSLPAPQPVPTVLSSNVRYQFRVPQRRVPEPRRLHRAPTTDPSYTSVELERGFRHPVEVQHPIRCGCACKPRRWCDLVRG
ncbi:MAG: hypothetical protein IPH60_18665 [Flavobacteriales bacterium]|nr:hypothetical protein [Flavobacteriales bacterium]